MCGISCILSVSDPTHRHTPNGTHSDAAAAAAPSNSDAKREALRKELHASLEQIRHRGPDATGDWISDDCRVGTLAYTLLLQPPKSILMTVLTTHPPSQP